MRKPFFLLLLVIFTVSCEKYIDMEIPDRGRKIVANCFYSDTGQVTVALYMSRFILDNSPSDMLSGAQIVFYENGIFLDTLSETQTGIYSSSSILLTPGANHTIRILKGENEVYAQSYMPQPIPFIIADTSRIKTEYNEMLRFRIRISDPLQTDNYYMIGFEMPDQDGEYEYQSYIYFGSNEPFIDAYYNNFGIFSDVLFKGQNQIMSFDIDLYNFYNETNNLHIKLYSISKDMYMYLVTLYAQQNAQDSPFSEPVIVYSNITNGYGIFGGFSNYTDSISIPQLSEGWGWIE
jgi:hypothetical protein